MTFNTYIIQSQKSGRFYIGHTQNLPERLKRHNTGMMKATKNRGPWHIIYNKEFQTKLEANHYELELKSQKSRVYIQRLMNNFAKL